jgi:hypothetical protein
MRTISAAILGAILFAAVPAIAAAEPEQVGKVDKVQGEASAYQQSQRRSLSPAAAVLYQDRLRTGASARLQATLLDGSQLTLGENGSLTVDDFVYKPGRRGGTLAIKVRGAFLFVGGKVEGPRGGNVTIDTPIGTLGVRGTTVWGGRIDGGYGVIVLDGQVEVKTAKGTVVLNKGQGTMMWGGGGPGKPAAWPDRRVKKAVATITFK